jgi:CheY-like chemotaxis protein
MAHASRNRISPEVLVVDDEAGMLQYLRRALELEYCAVETVCSGSAAIDRVRNGYDPDLILLDIEMPGLNGLDTLSQLLQFRPELKVVMCSCRDDDDTITRAHALGAHDYLPKPFRQMQLSDALRRWLH